MKNMNMSKMMNNMNNQKMPPMEMLQEMCGKIENKPSKMCMKIEESFNELIKINQEILKEIKSHKYGKNKNFICKHPQCIKNTNGRRLL